MIAIEPQLNSKEPPKYDRSLDRGEEPDPENGIGSNFSDNFVVQPEGPARQMSRLPWSAEWCLVKI